ncbi:MAG: hypothetical protein LJE83_01605 [Gammaproteobacteria bacterium]|jgi:hypothetical protein|nr:hypothetical protein [Gammaproteobacteria bacterium]
MCFKAGKDEIDTIRNLMRMSLLVLLSESLEIEAWELSGEARLVEDMKLDKAKAARLKREIAEYFDGLQINLDDTPTVDSLLEKIVETQMQ